MTLIGGFLSVGVQGSGFGMLVRELLLLNEPVRRVTGILTSVWNFGFRIWDFRLGGFT
jgi:hypothetical protein